MSSGVPEHLSPTANRRDPPSRWRPFPWFLLRATGFALEEAERCSAAPDVDTSWPERVESGRRALWDTLRSPRFRDALFVSSPQVEALLDTWYRHVQNGRRNGMDRKHERVLLRYLGRLTAKNDSTSFFGAIAAGRFDHAAPLDTVLPTESRRTVYVTQWVAQALLSQALADIGSNGQALVRAPGVEICPDQVQRWSLVDRRFERATDTQDPDQIALLTAIDDTQPADDLASVLGWPAARIETAWVGLRDAGMVEPADALPVGLVNPLSAAVDRLQLEAPGTTRERWLSRLQSMALEAERYGAAQDIQTRRHTLQGLETEVATWIEAPSRRRGGEFYASRSCLHEQAERTTAPTALPADWPDLLNEALSPYAELCLLPVAAERLKFRAWLGRTLASAHGDITWRDALGALRRDVLGYEKDAPPEARALMDAWRQVKRHLRARIDAHLDREGLSTPLSLDPSVLEEWIAPVRPWLDAIGTPFANPDLMVTTGGEAPRVVLAEAHHLPMLTGCLIPSLGVAEDILSDTRAFLASLCGDDMPGLVTSYQHSFISVSPDVGELALEISGRANRPTNRRAALAALRVRWERDRPRFIVRTHAGDDQWVAPLTRVARLQHASPVFPLTLPALGQWIAGSDWRTAEALPRLSYGSLTVHRRTWHLVSDLWVDRTSPASSAKRLWALMGDERPRFLFARSDEEAKPVLIDTWHAPAVELLWWMARRQPRLVLSEMLPGPGDLWLKSDRGHHTSELRTVWTRDEPRREGYTDGACEP